MRLAARSIVARHATRFLVVTGLIGAAVLLGRETTSARAAVELGVGLSLILAMLEVVSFWLARHELDVARNLRRVRDYSQSLSIYDRESGLYADWYFGLRLDQEIARCNRYGHPFTLLLIEQTGGSLDDSVRRLVFSALDDALRNTDIVAHLTDKRFAVLLTNTDSDGARRAGDRLREGLMPRPIRVGMASFPEDGRDACSLLTAAGASPGLVAGITRGIRKAGSKKTKATPVPPEGESSPIANATNMAQARHTQPDDRVDDTSTIMREGFEDDRLSNVVEFRQRERRCTIVGCGRRHHARGLCARHYAQGRRNVA